MNYEEQAANDARRLRLIDAVTDENLVSLRKIIKKEAVTDGDINAALLRAVETRKIDACRLLFRSLSSRAKTMHSEDENLSGCCLLHTAVYIKSLTMMRFLVQECNVNVNQLDRPGFTPLCISDDVKTSRFLLDNGADPNRCREWNRHPLWGALFSENVALIRLLLDHFADANFQSGTEVYEGAHQWSSSSMPAAIIAMCLGKAEFLSELLKHGAVLSRARLGFFFNWALYEMLLRDGGISREKKLAVCCTLVEHAQSNRTTRSFLHEGIDRIIQDNVTTSLEILLQAGINPRNQTMHDAVRREQISICQLLVQYGVNPFQRQSATITSLFDTAARETKTGVLEQFLAHWDERFASNGGRNDDGDYPIHVVCRFRNVPLAAIKLLIERQGPTVAITDGEQGLFPFHFAAMWNTDLEVVYSLVRHCPDALGWLGKPSEGIDDMTGCAEGTGNENDGDSKPQVRSCKMEGCFSPKKKSRTT